MFGTGMNVENKMHRHPRNFGFTRTAASLNKGARERDIDDGTLVIRSTASVHPDPVDVAQRVIAMTRRKGSNASSLVQVSTVQTQFHHRVVGTRPSAGLRIIFLPWMCVIWFSLFRRQCPTITPRCLRGRLFVLTAHREMNHPHRGQHRPHLWSPRRQHMELDQRGNGQTLAWTSLPRWCKADCQTQSLQVQNFGRTLRTGEI